MKLHITASTLVTALGRGEAANLQALRAGQSGLVPCTFGEAPRTGHVGPVAGLDEWRLDEVFCAYQCRNNALADMALLTDGFLNAAKDLVRRYGADRVASVIGTSTSGILAAEEAYRDRDPATGALPENFSYPHSYDLFSISAFVRQMLGLRGPALTVSTACASSARAFIDAHDLIAAGFADAALVGGTDSLCHLTLHGFASLGLIAEGACRPCDATRDGISIGEAAGFVLLERDPVAPGGVALLGFGASSDGYHISSPRPDGAGAARAMQEALARAGLAPEDIDYINLHGTGTRANDAMEDAAVTAVFGGDTPCSSTKGSRATPWDPAASSRRCSQNSPSSTGSCPGAAAWGRSIPRSACAWFSVARTGRCATWSATRSALGGIDCSLVFGPA